MNLGYILEVEKIRLTNGLDMGKGWERKIRIKSQNFGISNRMDNDAIY